MKNNNIFFRETFRKALGVGYNFFMRRERSLARLEKVAWVLDSGLRIPGTSITFGVDPLLGLIPGVGDALGMVLSLYLLAEAINLGANRRELARILGWIVLDGVLGLVPVLGDLFDFAFKSNQRIFELLRRRK